MHHDIKPGDLDHDFTDELNANIRRARRRHAFRTWYGPILLISAAMMFAGYLLCRALHTY